MIWIDVERGWSGANFFRIFWNCDLYGIARAKIQLTLLYYIDHFVKITVEG
jgi:hypothetical protein